MKCAIIIHFRRSINISIDSYLDKLLDIPDHSEFDNYPGEEYLDKLIEVSGIEPGSLT